MFIAFVFASPLGLLLALLPSPLYDFYVAAPRLRDLTPLEDQQIAGIAMAVSEAIVFFAAFAAVFVRFMAEEESARGYARKREEGGVPLDMEVGPGSGPRRRRRPVHRRPAQDG